MTEWRYEARDLRTGTLLGDLPLGDVELVEQLVGQGLKGTLSGTLALNQRSTPRRTIIPPVPGHVDIPFSNGNYLVVANTTTPVDASADWRVELVRPPAPPVTYRPIQAPTAFQFQATQVTVYIQNTTAGFPVASASYAALEAAGFPAIGEWVQVRGTWDTTTDTLAWYWRLPGLDLADDSGWLLAASLPYATQQLWSGTVGWILGGHITAAFGWNGKVRRWYRRINGVVDVDVNAATDFTDPNAVTFPATTGQTVTVFRSGSPATELVPTIPASVGATVQGVPLSRGFLDGTLCGRTVVWPYRDGVVQDGFIIWPRARRIGSRKLEIKGASLLSYPNRRVLTVTKSYTAVDQAHIAQDLMNFMQSHPAGNVGIVVPASATGVLRDRQPLGAFFERKNIGQLIDQLASVEGGFEYSIDASVIAGVPVGTFRVWYPRRGRRYAETGILLFRSGENSGNLLDYDIEEDATTMATTAHMIGAGEGAAMLLSTQTETALLDQGWPILEDVIAMKDILVKSTLDSHGRAHVRRHSRIAERWRLRVDANNKSIPFGTWIVGDEARVVISDDERFPAGVNGEPGYEGTQRIMGQTVNPRNGGGPDVVHLDTEVPLG